MKDILEKFFQNLKSLKKKDECFALKNSYFSQKIKEMEMRIKEEKNIETKKKIGIELKNLRKKIKEILDSHLESISFSEVFEDSTLRFENTTGYIHPLSVTISEIKTILYAMKMNFLEDEEIVEVWKNFDAVNIPLNHSCREDHQCIFLKNGKILRTHTSSIQHQVIKKYDNANIFTIGRTFRNDDDRTHTPMFHQLEVMSIDNNISLNSLIDFIQTFFNTFFEKTITMRFRPSYFPFTSFSMEIDILWKNNKWLEMGGCGLIHENVFKYAKRPFKNAFAAGFGVERLHMIKHEVFNLSELYNGNAIEIEKFKNFRSK